MRLILLLLTILFLAPLASASAQTVTTRDIVELSKSGLGEEVLLALIEVHRPVFPIDTETLKRLKDGGVPPTVIVAMIKSGRHAPPEVPAVAPLHQEPETPSPQIVVVEHDRHHEEPRIQKVAVPVPVYVPVPVRVRDRHLTPRPSPKPAEPVYWGFGGKLRPDAWKPTAADVQKDARVPREAQKK
jgi:hypothetical protein